MIDRLQILFGHPAMISEKHVLAAPMTSEAVPVDVLGQIVELTRGLVPQLPDHDSPLPDHRGKSPDWPRLGRGGRGARLAIPDGCFAADDRLRSSPISGRTPG